MTEPSNCGHYSSFVVRVWQDELTGEPRATLKNAATGEQQHFASLPLLMACLLNEASNAVYSGSETLAVKRSL